MIRRPNISLRHKIVTGDDVHSIVRYMWEYFLKLQNRQPFINLMYKTVKMDVSAEPIILSQEQVKELFLVPKEWEKSNISQLRLELIDGNNEIHVYLAMLTSAEILQLGTISMGLPGIYFVHDGISHAWWRHHHQAMSALVAKMKIRSKLNLWFDRKSIRDSLFFLGVVLVLAVIFIRLFFSLSNTYWTAFSLTFLTVAWFYHSRPSRPGMVFASTVKKFWNKTEVLRTAIGVIIALVTGFTVLGFDKWYFRTN